MPANAILVTDLDGTLLGNAAATDRFIEWWQNKSQSFRLVYASGRLHRSVLNSIQECSLPVPDAIVSGVGTELRFMPDAMVCEEWSNRWRSTWEPEKLSQLLDRHPDLVLQPDEFQSRFKLSYYFHVASRVQVEQIHRQLQDHAILAELTYSSNRDLDLLPVGASKGTAAGFLARHWNIPRSHVIAAGDSGNDLSLFAQHFFGVIVRNAHPELISVQSPSNFLAEERFADGVIQGVEFWLQTTLSC